MEREHANSLWCASRWKCNIRSGPLREGGGEKGGGVIRGDLSLETVSIMGVR